MGYNLIMISRLTSLKLLYAKIYTFIPKIKLLYKAL